jgi:hypothetical protein
MLDRDSDLNYRDNDRLMPQFRNIRIIFRWAEKLSNPSH